MSKHLSFTLTSPLDPQGAFEAGRDPEYLAGRAAFLGHQNLQTLAVEPDGEEFVVSTRKDVDVDLPGWAKKVLQPRNSVVQTDRWQAAAADGSREYHVTVDIHNVPVKVRGVVHFSPRPEGGSSYTVDFDIKASMPLVGGKLEDLVARDLTYSVEGEHTYVGQWAAEHS